MGKQETIIVKSFQLTINSKSLFRLQYMITERDSKFVAKISYKCWKLRSFDLYRRKFNSKKACIDFLNKFLFEVSETDTLTKQ